MRDELDRLEEEKLALAQRILDIQFRDRELLRTALTHPSHNATIHDHAHYERLEFLGDSVLGFLMTDRLFHEYPEFDEGRMTRVRSVLVSGRAIGSAAESLGLGDAVIMGPDEREIRGRQTRSFLADVFEALVGAVYLERGMEGARDFLFRALPMELIDRTVEESLDEEPKNVLQELTQARDGGLPEYRIASVEGPPHERTFTAEVALDGVVLGTGSGPTKKQAQRSAASAALERLHEDVGEGSAADG